ncbi:MAG TPA: ribonuclease E/G [Thermohalobaculum sp.]|nr:ribonuclease E/G [Thermohalobaculum sp.]
MTDRLILLDVDVTGAGDVDRNGATRAALLLDGRLEDLLIDPPEGDTAPAPGAIFWAKVDRLVPKMGGAFVRLTPARMGFLREAKGAREGRFVLVQVAAYAEPGKATPVTPNVLHKSPRVIYTPHAPGVNVSRRIRDDGERTRLSRAVEEALDGAGLPGGFIVRTGAQGADAAQIASEVRWALAQAEAVRQAAAEAAPLERAAGSPLPAALLALREWAFAGPVRLRASGSALEALGAARAAGDLWGDETLFGAIERHDGSDLFDQHGVREAIEALKSPRVALPSGGWMAVEATRAMVTVDVNTAAEFSGGSALTANLEAARELPRQLRLRGLGGQVIVDFAPVRKTDRRRIEEALKAAFRRDAIETSLAGWTPLGNFELQRKRERRPLAELPG